MDQQFACAHQSRADKAGMRLVLLVHRHAGTEAHGYLRAVDRAYSRVPMTGEMVMLDDVGEVGHHIDLVSWDNNGSPVLRVSDPPVSAGWLISAGFELVYPAPVAP